MFTTIIRFIGIVIGLATHHHNTCKENQHSDEYDTLFRVFFVSHIYQVLTHTHSLIANIMLFNQQPINIKSYDSQNNGMHFGKNSTESLGLSDEIWYPVTGRRSGSGSSFTDMYNDGNYWSARIGSVYPYGLYFCGYYQKIEIGYINVYRSNAYAVRCIKE